VVVMWVFSIMLVLMGSMVVIMCMTVTVTVTGTTAMSMVMALVITAEVIMTITLVKNLDLDQIEEQADNRDDEHSEAFDLIFLSEAVCSFNTQPDRHDPHCANRDEGANDLCAVPAERERFTFRLLRKFQSNHRNRKSKDIGSQVR